MKIPKIPNKYSHVVFALIMSVLMATIMTGVVTLRLTGPTPGVFTRWLHAFLTAWPIAFPCIFLIAPLSRKLASKFCAS